MEIFLQIKWRQLIKLNSKDRVQVKDLITNNELEIKVNTIGVQKIKYKQILRDNLKIIRMYIVQ